MYSNLLHFKNWKMSKILQEEVTLPLEESVSLVSDTSSLSDSDSSDLQIYMDCTNICSFVYHILYMYTYYINILTINDYLCMFQVKYLSSSLYGLGGEDFQSFERA